MSYKTGFLVASAASLLALFGCNSNETANPSSIPAGAVAATVNGIAISESRVTLLLGQSAAQGHADSANMRAEAIDNLAMQLLLSQEASKKGLDKTPEVADQLDLMRQTLLAKAFVQDYIKNTTVGEDMLKDAYEKVKGQFAGNEYKARHILVAQESVAKDVIAKLNKNPNAFESLAKERSIDPGSKAKGGNLDWFDPHGMVPEFSAAVSSLEKGKFTQTPVKTQFGYHVIMLDDSRPKEAPSFEQLKPLLQQQVMQQNLKKLLDDMKAKAKVDIVQATAQPKVEKPTESVGK